MQALTILEAKDDIERSEQLFSLSFILIKFHMGRLRYCNGGRPPPTPLRIDGTIKKVDSGGTVIGRGNFVTLEEGDSWLKPGDRLFMYTDGITEHLTTSEKLMEINAF